MNPLRIAVEREGFLTREPFVSLALPYQGAPALAELLEVGNMTPPPNDVNRHPSVKPGGTIRLSPLDAPRTPAADCPRGSCKRYRTPDPRSSVISGRVQGSVGQ
jgi:hypothetical protein